MAEQAPALSWADDAQGPTVAVQGDWTLERAGEIQAAIERLPEVQGRSVHLDAGGLGRLDTSGAWLLLSAIDRLRERGASAVALDRADPAHREVLDQVERVREQVAQAPRGRRRAPAGGALARTGMAVEAGLRAAAAGTRDFLGFLGVVLATLWRIATGRARLRLTPVAFHMEQLWLRALPIVGVLTFVIGATITYNSADKLELLQAEVYSINLIALAMLREVGVVIAGIVVAGRSGSTFTVELGTMTARQEIDAMRTTGIDPVEVLVVPRLVAAVLAFPLLVFFADIMGLVGGGLAASAGLGIGPELFVKRLADTVNLDMIAVGLLKAPVLGAAVALAGCYQGLRTGAAAADLGRQTTRAVVQAIFFVLLLDAMFAVLFSELGL